MHYLLFTHIFFLNRFVLTRSCAHAMPQVAHGTFVKGDTPVLPTKVDVQEKRSCKRSRNLIRECPATPATPSAVGDDDAYSVRHLPPSPPSDLSQGYHGAIESYGDNGRPWPKSILRPTSGMRPCHPEERESRTRKRVQFEFSNLGQATMVTECKSRGAKILRLACPRVASVDDNCEDEAYAAALHWEVIVKAENDTYHHLVHENERLRKDIAELNDQLIMYQKMYQKLEEILA